jgi:hypothetical protein
MHISYNWSSLRLPFSSSCSSCDGLVYVVKKVVGCILHHEASRTSLSLDAIDVLLGHNIPRRHVFFHTLRVASRLARGQRRTRFGDTAFEAVFVEFLMSGVYCVSLPVVFGRWTGAKGVDWNVLVVVWLPRRAVLRLRRRLLVRLVA